MDIKSLADLQKPDDMVMRFVPIGHFEEFTAEQAAEYQQQKISHLDLTDSVPDGLRASFERVRSTYAYGALSYDFYTVAHDLACLVLEQGLRERFLQEHVAGAVFVDAAGVEHTISAGTFEQLHGELATDNRLRRPSKWRLRLQKTQGTMYFDGMLDSLVRWARAEDLLHGQRNRHHEKLLAKMRNLVAHSASYHLAMPGDAAQAIADLAEIINRLWDHPTPGGRLYPAPVQREVVAIGWTPAGTLYSGLAEFFGPPSAEDLTCVLVKANRHDELFNFDAQYETTGTPCELLWGPGPWPQAAEWLQRELPAEDTVELLDRDFLVRYHDFRVYLPRNPDLAAGLGPQERTGEWFLIRADHPVEVFSHARQLLAGASGCAASGPCPRCAVETVRRGTLQDLLNHLAAGGTVISARTAPDVRVSSMWPRWNEIQGNGSWSVPTA
jgi:hypothetical protein